MKKEEASKNSANTAAPAEQAAPSSEEQLTAEQIADLKQQAAKAAESWDRLLRTTADFDNYKKRVTREKQEAIKYANESLIEKLLPVLDNFEMALAAIRTTESESSQALEQGIGLVFQQFRQVLKDAGLEEINASGATFDPNFHEAISAQESADTPEGQVLHQMRKGYKLRDKLIRPASVVVAKPPAAQPQP